MPLLRTMQCLRSATRTITGKVLAGATLFVALGSGVAWCISASSQRIIPLRTPLAELERNLRRIPAHVSEFAPVAELLAVPICGEVRPPEALLSPDPVLQAQDVDLRVRVSFIVGADGHVHSAFILVSGGPDEDQLILRAVHRWRYRPALCNGVPTDTEARVLFATR
ncbi:MAG TPA: TonB family protein [Terriglobales bacterium]